MVSDHFLLSQIRQELADALRGLLKAERMGPTDFKPALDHAIVAVEGLRELLRQHFVEEA